MAPRGTHKAAQRRQNAAVPTGAPRTATDPEGSQGLTKGAPASEVQCPDGCKPETFPSPSQTPEEVMLDPPRIEEPYEYPAGWRRGQMLNVRQAPDGWYITPIGVEYDFAQPEKGLRLTDYGQAQGFVSWWYARDYAPR